MNANTGNPGTILIVDDDPAVLVLIQRILTAADYRVLPAVARADAVRLASQKHVRIDLALLDVRMPGVSGTELADELQSLRPNLRVLWMSGFVDEEFIRLKLIDRYAGFLAKPLLPSDLLLAVQNAITGERAGEGAPERRQVQQASTANG